MVQVGSLCDHHLRGPQQFLEKEGRQGIEYLHGTVQNMGKIGEFDSAFAVFLLHYARDKKEMLQMCSAVFANLKPGGRFLVEGINKSWIVKHFGPRSEQTIGGIRIIHQRCWNAKTSRVADTWTLCRGRKKEQHRLSMRIYNGSEMRSLLRAAGFRDIKLHPNPPLGRFTRHSRRFIAVASKPRG